MKMKLAIAAVVCLVAGAILIGPSLAAADPKPEKIANLDEFLKANADYAKMDTAAKCDYLATLCDKDRRIDFAARKWMQFRVLMEQAKKDGIDKDLPKLLGWVGPIVRDFKNPIQKSANYALDAIIVEYGTRRLYADETFAKGDIKAKLKRIKDLWAARELGQSASYELTNCLVYQYLAPAKGAVDEEIKLMAELVAADVMVWDSTASIQHSLLLRALYEKPELNDNLKRMKWITETADSKGAKLSAMMVMDLRAALLMEVLINDEEFQKLDYAARGTKIDGWAKDGYLSPGDASTVKAAFCATK